ncbi:M23 family metallopeptidase [Jatrophihabitans sp. DSM 45814]
MGRHNAPRSAREHSDHEALQARPQTNQLDTARIDTAQIDTAQILSATNLIARVATPPIPPPLSDLSGTDERRRARAATERVETESAVAAAATISAAEFLAKRSAEFARPTRTRAAEKAKQGSGKSGKSDDLPAPARRTPTARPLWRRSPAIPALAAALAVWGSTEGYQLVASDLAGAQGGAHSGAHGGSAVDLSGLATAAQSQGILGASSGGLLASGPEQVSRSSRDRESQSGSVASASLLPLRQTLPKVQPGKTVLGTWVRPSSGGMSSCFCMRWGVMHEGIDLAAPLGSAIVATGDGVVLEAGPAAGFGHWIVIQQANGDVTIYGHMYDVSLVTKGEHVVAGQHIADVGADGEATGPHLHFGVRQGGMNGPYIDPVPWLKARGVDVGPYNPNA